MTQRSRVRILTVFSLIAFAAAVTFTVFALRRATTLQSLRVTSEVALKSLYRLTVDTDTLMYATTNYDRAYEPWQSSIDESNEQMLRVITHPALPLLSETLNVHVEQADRLWVSTLESLRLGNDLMSSALGRELPALNRGNLESISAQVRDLLASDTISASDRASYELLARGIGQVAQANSQLRNFVGNELEGLGDEVETSVATVTRVTIMSGGAAGLVLLLLVVIALLTSLRFLSQANANLENAVRSRTRAIQGLLDFSGQGFLSFGPDLVVRPEISRECDVIFGYSIVGENIAALLYADQRERVDFEEALRMVFDGDSPAEVVFELFEKRMRRGDKVIELDFRQIDEDHVMCSLADITDQVALEESLAEQKKQQEMVLRIVSNRDYFFALADEWEDLSARLGKRLVSGDYVADEEQNGQIIRDVHTFKANAAFLQMDVCVDAAHQLETVLIDYGVLGESQPVVEAVAVLSAAYGSESEHVLSALGAEWSQRRDTVSIERCTLDEILDHARRSVPDDPVLLSGLQKMRMLPAEALVSRWSDLASQLAVGRGKMVRVDTKCGESRFTPETHEALSQAVTHIIRNMIDHGIELPRDRERAGKDPVGTIAIRIEQDANRDIDLTISDDGAGICTQKLAEKARALGLINNGDEMSRHDLMKLIFRPGFSTAEGVTDVSGRGVGAGAALELVRRIGGKLSLSTREGRGTTFYVKVPDPEREITYCES